MIHSAKPAASLVANIVFTCCFVWEKWGRTDDMCESNDHYRHGRVDQLYCRLSTFCANIDIFLIHYGVKNFCQHNPLYRIIGLLRAKNPATNFKTKSLDPTRRINFYYAQSSDGRKYSSMGKFFLIF